MKNNKITTEDLVKKVTDLELENKNLHTKVQWLEEINAELLRKLFGVKSERDKDSKINEAEELKDSEDPAEAMMKGLAVIRSRMAKLKKRPKKEAVGAPFPRT
jgi:hypothetical protein